MRIAASDIDAFEKALARTDFAIVPEEGQPGTWLDYPPEEVMERYAGSDYHFVHRVGGIREPGIHDAGVILENLARRLCPK
jgi:hypothetical protein